MSHRYDAVGNRIATTDAEGHTTTFSYGGNHVLARIEEPNGAAVALSYNREGWLTRVVNGRGQEHRLVRDARGLVIEEVTFDGRRLRYGYDEMARCVSVINGLGERTEYTRDAMGRIIGIVYADGRCKRCKATLRVERTGSDPGMGIRPTSPRARTK